MAGDHLCTGRQAPDHVSSCKDGLDYIYRRGKRVRSLSGILMRKILLVHRVRDGFREQTLEADEQGKLC